MAWKMQFAAAGAAFVIAVTGCSHEPPHYESRYTGPTPQAPPRPPMPAGASFIDDFSRPNSAQGLGPGWQIHELQQAADGTSSFPPSSDAYISDGLYAVRGDKSIYAVRGFGGKVRRVGVGGAWAHSDGTAGSVAVGITADPKLTGTNLQFTASARSWALETRRAGTRTRRLLSGNFNPPLEFGSDHRFEMTVADEFVTVALPRGEEKRAKLATERLLGNFAFWEHQQATSPNEPIDTRFGVAVAWAAEEGQPLKPIPSAE